MEDKNRETGTGEPSVLETQITMPKKKHLLSKSARKYLIYGIIIAAVTALTLYYLLKEDPSAIISNLSKADWRYILVIVGLVIFSAILTGLTLTLLTKKFNPKYRLHQGVVNGLIGSFFSNVTPFASGGQFIQVYTYTRQNVKAANAASILVMQFIVFQSLLLLFAIISFFLGYNTIITKLGNVTLLGITFSPVLLSVVGFIINVFTIGSLFLLSFCRPLHRVVLNSGINLLAKMHLVKNPDKKRTELTAQVASFRVEFKRLITNWKIMIPVIIVFAIRFVCDYSIPFFAAKAVGASMNGNYFESLYSSSYLAMITSFIPIPGGSGGAEWGFQSLFLGLIDNNAILTKSANILWRGLTYYLLTLIGAMTFALYRGTPKVSTEKIGDTQTFKDLDLTPFIRHADLKDYDMLEARYKRLDDRHENKAEILTSDEVVASFKKIKRTLKQHEEQPMPDDDLTNKTKKYLKTVMTEATEIEDGNRDPEIMQAIEGDEAFLVKEREKHKERKLAKKAAKERNKK